MAPFRTPHVRICKTSKPQKHNVKLGASEGCINNLSCDLWESFGLQATLNRKTFSSNSRAVAARIDVGGRHFKLLNPTCDVLAREVGLMEEREDGPLRSSDSPK